MTESINLTHAAHHQIDECFLDIEVEKKLLDTFFYRLESEKTNIKLKDYDVQSADTCRNLESSIKKRVLSESESTEENLGEDLAVALKNFEQKKGKYNKIIKDQPELALDGYLRIDRSIDETLMQVRDPKMFETVEYKKILEEKTKICSNISNCYGIFKDFRNAVQFCKKCIEIDPCFDKSYAKMIQCYISMNPPDVYAAENIKKQMMDRFNESTRQKYADIFDQLQTHVTASENVIFIFIF